VEIWTTSLQELDYLMHKLDTDPTLIHIIVEYLKGWRTNEGISYVPPREFQELVQQQQLVGWGRFFEGWLVKLWAIKQHNYYKTRRSNRSGRRWASAIILKLWNTAWDVWEHRNAVLNDQENSVTQLMHNQLNARVSRAYNDLYSRTLQQHNRHLVHLTLYNLLRRDTNYKVAWLSVAEPALKAGRSAAWRARTSDDCMLHGMRRGLLSWLWR
jgi:hypothetical protein